MVKLACSRRGNHAIYIVSVTPCTRNFLNTVTWIIQLCTRNGTLFHLEILSVVHLINVLILVFPLNSLYVAF